MTKFFVIFLAFAFGLFAFATLQDKELPPELEFLLSKTGGVGTSLEPGSFSETKLDSGWLLRTQGESIELSKRMANEIVVGESRYDAPVVGILCQSPRIDARIDTRILTQGGTHTPVSINNGAPSQWVKGSGTNIFPLDAYSFIRELANASGGSMLFTFQVEGVGPVSTTLEVSSLNASLNYLSSGCFSK